MANRVQEGVVFPSKFVELAYDIAVWPRHNLGWSFVTSTIIFRRVLEAPSL